MTEVKDVPAPGARSREDLAGGLDAELLAAQAARRIEVALDRSFAHASAPFVEVHVPVDAHHRRTGFGHQVEQLTSADAEEDRRYAEVGDAFEHSLGRGQREALVFVAGERAGPRVKELQGACAVLDLETKKRDGDRNQPVEESIEERGVRVHQALD